MGTAGKAKFKVGDRVEVFDHPYTFSDQVVFGLIEHESRKRGDWIVRVEYALSDGESAQQSLGFHASEMRLTTIPTSTPHIVAVIENGTPKPNARPRIHDTESSATIEAERLAKLNPGQTFGVFVQTTARVADVTVRVV